MTSRVAVIQKPPVLLDREATIERALDSIEEAVGKGASLLVFPEAYIPGYPTWIWRLRPGGDTALSGAIHARLRENALFDPEEWINDGNAVVVKPTGTVVAGPLSREKGILYAEIDKEDARRARRSLDLCGHYSRPDIFSFSVDRRPLNPVTFSD